VPNPFTVHGFKVVSSAKALGNAFCGNGKVQVDWQGLLAKVLKVFTFIARLPLSLFGCAFAAAGYGISMLLYCAEFIGLPPPDVMQELNRASAELVDRPFCRYCCGPFNGSTGGVGAMPWMQHILARHAIWGVRLMLCQSSILWVHVARYLLVPQGNSCPAWSHLRIAMCRSHQSEPTWRPLPLALRRRVAGLRALPAMRDVLPLQVSQVLGLWCRDAPLWCNPFLMQGTAPMAGEELSRQGLESSFGDMAELRTLSTFGCTESSAGIA